MAYHTPTDLIAALDHLASGDVSIVAGATDWFPSHGDRPVRGDILDITRLSGMRGINRQTGGWHIGAATTWTDILRADLPPAFDGLKAAAREVGSIQIQNVGTIAGNICNASPAADGIPPLLTLNARIHIASRGGARDLPLDQFVTGVRRTALCQGELVTGISVPDPDTAARGAFLKLGGRKYLVISIAMVAVVVTVRDNRIVSAQVAVGACSAVAQRMTALETALIGTAFGDFDIRLRAEHVAELTPITDMRGTADYRLTMARELIVRTLHMAVSPNITPSKERSNG